MATSAKRAVRICLSILLAAISLMAIVASTSAAPAIHVHPGDSIQAAIDAAAPGAMIMVEAGTYNEYIMITKPIKLMAQGSVTIDATGELNGITVDGVNSANPPVIINGFTVENANLSGVLISNSSFVRLSNNTIQNNDQGLVLPTDPSGEPTCPDSPFPLLSFDCGEGVNLNGASYSVLLHNVVQGNFGGILLSDELGPTHHNVLSQNQVLNNREECGITMASHPAAGSDLENPLPGNGIYGNLIIHNVSNGNGGAGIGVFAATPGTKNYNNTIIGNDVNDNGMPGITVHSHTPAQNVSGNRFLLNTLSGNGWFGDPDIGLVPSLIGIEIFADGSSGTAPITNTVAFQNRITNEDIGVWVGTTATDSSIHVNFNWFNGLTIGVENAGTGTLDATKNYWGCAAGPASSDCAGVVGSVNYSPWIP